MKKIVVKIRLLTPAFIGDAEKNASFLNEKAIKGALRFWWRAFLSKPQWSVQELLQNETAIFGGQDKKSKFAIDIVGRSEELNRTDLNVSAFPGIQYLFYSKINTREHLINSRTYLEPGSAYEIRFTFFDDSTVKPVLESLLFFENFGGIGARSRRGAGSFKIEEIKGLDNDAMNGLLNKKQELINVSSRKGASLPDFTAYSKEAKFKKFEKKWKKWEDALNDLGNAFFNFRYYKNKSEFSKQANALHEFAINGNDACLKTSPPQKVFFGLPIRYSFKDANGKIIKYDKPDPKTGKIKNLTLLAEPELSKKETVLNRRSSPLFFKVGKEDNHYYINALILPSKFLPDNKYEISGKVNPFSPTEKHVSITVNDNNFLKFLHEFFTSFKV